MLMDLSSEIYHALLPVFITATLGLPVSALGAIDGISEATANFAKLASGRLSDRMRRRKPLILAGYGLAALSKPLFPIADSDAALMGARFTDRIGKGIRGAPRDGMIADETPPEIRGRAFGLRQSLDTVGAMLAPLAAIGLMFLLAGDIRMVFWIATVPALLSFLLAWLALREPRQAQPATSPARPKLSFRDLDKPTRRLLGVSFLFALARFSESFLIVRGLDVGLSPALSPLTLVLFNLVFVAFAYPAGSLTDRHSPRAILMIGLAVLIAGNLILATSTGLIGFTIGVALWGAHMALTQGTFARMIADIAPPHLKATSFGAFYFVAGVGNLLGSLGAGILWDRDGPSAAFYASAAAAMLAVTMLSLLPSAKAQLNSR
jgi:MFS family permease